MSIYLRESESASGFEYEFDEVRDSTNLVEKDDLSSEHARGIWPEEPHKLLQLGSKRQSVFERNVYGIADLDGLSELEDRADSQLAIWGTTAKLVQNVLH